MDSAALERARASFANQKWSDAYAQLTAADRERPLDVEDLERLAVAAHVTGDLDGRGDAFARAYNESLRRGDLARAARFAFLSAFGYIDRGERARAEGRFTTDSASLSTERAAWSSCSADMARRSSGEGESRRMAGSAPLAP